MTRIMQGVVVAMGGMPVGLMHVADLDCMNVDVTRSVKTCRRQES